MDGADLESLIRQLTVGFEVLQEEYRGLYSRHRHIERKLATAKEQYHEIAQLYGTSQTSTPPLSLSSSSEPTKADQLLPVSVAEILATNVDDKSKQAADAIQAADYAARSLKNGLPLLQDGVKIWAGPSADRVEGSSCMMPSISESPLEQDFTVEGKPSRLGCPFASMARKKLSSHAASVLSRYNQGSAGAHGSVAAQSTPLSATSHINGKESLSQRQSRRASTADPIKAEICGLSDHNAQNSERATGQSVDKAENADTGVCPIRFLDQHSPEEVATYFEKHKHELPRSHEVCVMRYQSNDEQIRQLDAKYGNLVSMIQGLGKKHKEMLPPEPEDAASSGGLSESKVRKWASSVSAQAPEPGAEEESDERQPHFERPLRDIRVGESPSRPWGIPVPARYLEKDQSEASSRPAEIIGPAIPNETPQKPAVEETPVEQAKSRPAGKCPFGHGAPARPSQDAKLAMNEPGLRSASHERLPVNLEPSSKPQLPPNNEPIFATSPKAPDPRMIFTGPVFIGYSPEDALRIFCGLNQNSGNDPEHK